MGVVIRVRKYKYYKFNLLNGSIIIQFWSIYKSIHLWIMTLFFMENFCMFPKLKVQFFYENLPFIFIIYLFPMTK